MKGYKMELSDLGQMLLSFLGGNGIGAVATSYVYYAIGKKRKNKQQLLTLADRVKRLEERVGIK